MSAKHDNFLKRVFTIRPEIVHDRGAIARVTKAAFAHHPHGEHTEHFIIDALRDADALAISLVAATEVELVGHIAFSPVEISDGSQGWHGLGPVSVLPSHQKQGIGSALINEGLSLLAAMDAVGCVLLGEPDYYGRFGFTNRPTLVFEGVPQEYFLAFDIRPNRAHGKVVYHPAFSASR